MGEKLPKTSIQSAELAVNWNSASRVANAIYQHKAGPIFKSLDDVLKKQWKKCPNPFYGSECLRLGPGKLVFFLKLSPHSVRFFN